MSSTKNNRNARTLRSAIAGTALLAASGVASAAPVSLNLDFVCPLPLIGNQPISAQISADFPPEAQVGDTFGPFAIEATTTVNNDSRLGLKLVGSATIEGSATNLSTVRTAGRDLPLDVPLTIPQSPIPDAEGPFTVPASGEAPAVTFTMADVGQGTVTVDDLTLNMVARTADGAIAPPPIGEFTADCTLVEGQDNVLHTFEVTGEAVPDPEISVGAENVDFGKITSGTSAEEVITVSNTGGADLGINAITLSGANADAFMQTNDCTTVAPGESCGVTVTYIASGEGVSSAALAIESTDPATPSVEVALTGESIITPVPEISLDATEVSFGKIDVGTSADRQVTVTNAGGAALTINAISLSGDNAGDFFQTNDCSTVAAEGSCTVSLTYTANAEGASNAVLSIESDDPEAATVEVALSGEGKSNDTGGGVDFLLDLQGTTGIAASDSSLPLSGTIDAVLELATGMFTADLALDDTEGSFQVIKFFKRLKATAQVNFEQTQQTTGTLVNGVLTADSQMYINIPKVTVKLFGFKLPIGGGSECRTMDPVNISLKTPEGESFAPLEGGKVVGTYDLPALSNCGPLTDILNHYMAGPGNTINLDLTPNL